MTGLIDVGGGMRDSFGAGVTDCLLDHKITFPYMIGVSAGSGNLVSYQAGQRDRNRRYYEEYSRRPEYMGMKSFLTRGNYFNLDYIYGQMSIEGGEDPVDYDALMANPAVLKIAACDVKTGRTMFFDKRTMKRNDFSYVMASCCVPAFCRPVEIRGRRYVDGGTAQPIPWRKAFRDGCDKIVVILTLREDDILEPAAHRLLADLMLLPHPKIAHILNNRHKTYNRQIEELLALESRGRAVIIAPRDLYGMTSTTNDRVRIHDLYEEGYRVTEEKIRAGKIR
jgi:predicted patatin/cPLA2 family phospholipase